MKIVLIGSGNVAWNLGKLFVNKGNEVVQIISRNAATATELAYELNTESANYFSIINKDADLYVIAVKDEAITAIAVELKELNKLIVHTSGALPIDVLKECSTTYGTLYPLQSLLYGAKQLPQIPFLVQANTPTVTNQLQQFVQSLQMPVSAIMGNDKVKLHIAAVLVNNFTHHLYVMAQQWCKQQQLDFSLLLPLLSETTNRVVSNLTANEQFDLKKLQTGPAIRNDDATIAQHLALIDDDKKLVELYQLFTKWIKEG